ERASASASELRQFKEKRWGWGPNAMKNSRRVQPRSSASSSPEDARSTPRARVDEADVILASDCERRDGVSSKNAAERGCLAWGWGSPRVWTRRRYPCSHVLPR